MVFLRTMSLLGIVASFTGCQQTDSLCGFLPDGGKGDPDYLTPEAQACPDRASLGFAQEFGSGTYIGTSVPDTLSIKNGGIADLSITSAVFSGDPAFKLETEPAVPGAIKGRKQLLLRVLFAPTEARLYTGKLTVQSNAANSPSLEFPVSGCGVPSDGGTSPCYRDGGLP
jgi:hypothetical protein